MVELNLLAWRQQQYRYERTILWRYLAVGVIFSLLAVGMIHLMLTASNERQAARNEALRMRLPDEDHQDAAADNDSQQYFSADFILNLFSATANFHDVCYTQLMREQSKVTLTGSAWSLMSVTQLLNESGLKGALSDLQLAEIKRLDNVESLQFSLAAREA